MHCPSMAHHSGVTVRAAISCPYVFYDVIGLGAFSSLDPLLDWEWLGLRIKLLFCFLIVCLFFCFVLFFVLNIRIKKKKNCNNKSYTHKQQRQQDMNTSKTTWTYIMLTKFQISTKYDNYINACIPAWIKDGLQDMECPHVLCRLSFFFYQVAM